MAGNHASYKQQVSMGRQRRAGTSRLTGNHIFWGDECPGGRQRKVGKGIHLQRLKVACCSLCCHYNKVSLAEKKYPLGTDTMTLLLKTKEG